MLFFLLPLHFRTKSSDAAEKRPFKEKKLCISDNTELAQKITCYLIQMDPSLPRIPIMFHNNHTQISTTILIDSCSSACIISHKILKLLKLSFVKKKYQLITANTTDKETLTGNLDLNFTIYDNNDQETNLIKCMFLVSKSDINIIGIDFLKKYNYRLNTDNLELEFPSIVYRNKQFITSVIRTPNEPIIASIEYYEILPDEIIWIRASIKSQTMTVDWNNTNVQLFKHTNLELLSQNVTEDNILNLMIKNSSPDIYIEINEGESIGYLELNARYSQSFYIRTKPWKVSSNNLPTVTVQSNLIEQSFVKEVELDNGTFMDCSLSDEQFLEENLDIPLVDESHSVNNIPHDHLAKTEWTEFKHMFEEFSIKTKKGNTSLWKAIMI